MGLFGKGGALGRLGSTLSLGLLDNEEQNPYYQDPYLQELNTLNSDQYRRALASGDINQAQNLSQRQGMLTDGLTGSRIAAQEVQNNPLTRSLFGQGGLSSRLDTEEQQLANQGWKLTDQDRTAYGQAAGDIGRLFGNQEKGLARSLAARGLGNSGAAGAMFSGLQGNKNEQLAQMQMQIANQRMENTRQRLNSTRQMMQGLGRDALSAQNDQFGRQLSGANQYRQSMLDRGQLGNAEFERQQGAISKPLFSRIMDNAEGLIAKAPQIGASALAASYGGPQAGQAVMQADGNSAEGQRQRGNALFNPKNYGGN